MGWALMCPPLQMMLFIFNCSTFRLVRHQDKYTLGAGSAVWRCVMVPLGKLNFQRAHSFFSICQKSFRALGDILPCQLGVRGDAEASPHMRLCSSPCSPKNLKIFSINSKFAHYREDGSNLILKCFPADRNGAERFSVSPCLSSSFITCLEFL